MFDNFKLKLAKNKISKLVEQLKYRDAYEHAMVKVFRSGLDHGTKPLIDITDNNSMYNLMITCRMPEKEAELFNAKFNYEIVSNRSSQTRIERYNTYAQKKFERGRIDEYTMVRDKILFQKSLIGSIDPEYYSIKLKTNELNHLKVVMPDASDEELAKKEHELREEILKLRFRRDEISYLDYEKSLYSLRGEKWFNYQIKIDEEDGSASAFELQIDYNDEFVEWLESSGVTLDEADKEGIDPDSEEYVDLLVEKWAKNSLMTLAATMLVDDGGETFRSVVASEPEGTIVQQLEIDRENLEEYYGDSLTSDQIKEIAEKTRNRRMYK